MTLLIWVSLGEILEKTRTNDGPNLREIMILLNLIDWFPHQRIKIALYRKYLILVRMMALH